MKFRLLVGLVAAEHYLGKLLVELRLDLLVKGLQYREHVIPNRRLLKHLIPELKVLLKEPGVDELFGKGGLRLRELLELLENLLCVAFELTYLALTVFRAEEKYDVVCKLLFLFIVFCNALFFKENLLEHLR